MMRIEEMRIEMKEEINRDIDMHARLEMSKRNLLYHKMFHLMILLNFILYVLDFH